MKFICLGCLDKEAWGRLSAGEQAALVVECTNFDQELAAAGHFAAGYALQDSAKATTVRWNGGKAAQVAARSALAGATGISHDTLRSEQGAEILIATELLRVAGHAKLSAHASVRLFSPDGCNSPLLVAVSHSCSNEF